MFYNTAPVFTEFPKRRQCPPNSTIFFHALKYPLNMMRLWKEFIAFLVLCLFAIQPACAESPGVFNAKSFTLDNGLQVVLVENHRAPILTHMIWYKVGGADDPPGKSGLAHMFEHLMFKGTENMGPGEFSKRVRAMGGEDNAFTSYDYTAYFQTIASKHLETVMEMEAERMRHLTMPPQEFASEQKVVMEERRQRTENDPRARFFEQLDYTLFPHHPYGIPLIGWMSEIENLTRKDARQFYNRWYAPNNAVLIVSGDVTLEKLQALAEQYYGPLKLNPSLHQSRQRPELADFQGDTRSIYTHPRVKQPLVVRLIRIPSASHDKKVALALQILEKILAGGPTTRLYQSLVVKQKLASSAGLTVRTDAYNRGKASFYASPRPGISPEQVESALLEEIRLLIKNGVTPDEVRQAKDQLQAEAVFARDSVSGPAMIIGRAVTTGSSLQDVETWPQRIEAITQEQIEQAARQWLDPDKTGNLTITGYLLPETPAPSKEEKND